MRVEFAHLRELSSTGRYVNFAIFTGVTPTSDTATNKDKILNRLILGAQSMGLKVDQGAFVYRQAGQSKIWGEPFPSDILKKRGVPRMTHYMEIDL